MTPAPRQPPARGAARRSLASALALLVVGAVACGSGSDDDAGGGSSRNDAGSNEARTVTHAAGATEVPAGVERVVALDQPAALGALALGVEPVAVFAGFASQPPLDEILASYHITPEPLTLSSPSFEAVAGARPDLIVGSGHPGTIAAFDRYSAIAPTVVVPFVADWHDQLDVTAQALGRDDDADRLATRIDQDIDGVRTALAEEGLDGATVSVLGAIRSQPFAFPRSGLAGHLLAEIGLDRPAAQDVDVPAEQGFVMFSPERLTDHDADILITVTGAVYDTDQVITASPLYGQLDAVRDGRVFEVSGDMWLGAFPFAAAWIVEDLDAVVHGRQPGTTDTLDRWTTLVE